MTGRVRPAVMYGQPVELQQLEVVRGLAAACHRQLLAERNAHQASVLSLEAERLDHAETMQLLLVAMAESLRHQAIAADLARELARLNHASVLIVIEKNSLVARCQAEAEDRLRLEQTARASRTPARRSHDWDYTAPDTDVVDEPARGPGQTQHIRVSSMADTIRG